MLKQRFLKNSARVLTVSTALLFISKAILWVVFENPSVEEKLGYPVFIKPSNAGSSQGVSKAHDREELLAGIKVAAEHDRKILVEEAIVGRELECAVLGGREVKASGIGEILAAAEFYDYEAKYINDSTGLAIPAILPDYDIIQCPLRVRTVPLVPPDNY